VEVRQATDGWQSVASDLRRAVCTTAGHTWIAYDGVRDCPSLPNVDERTRLEQIVLAAEVEPRAMLELNVPGSGEHVFAVEVEEADAFRSWERLRALSRDLDRCPVAVMSHGRAPRGEELFSRFYYGSGDQSPDAVLRRARALSADGALSAWTRGWKTLPERWPESRWPEIVRHHLRATERHAGSAPALADVLAQDLGFDEWVLERWLLDWEEARRQTSQPDDGLHLTWFDPGQPVILALLPVPNSEESLAYASFYGAEGERHHEELIAIARRWRERFGADLYANWGSMLQFVVARPPSNLHDAFEVTLEQARVAGSTIYLPGRTIRQHARALVDRKTWFLHERP
jgi:hypothetical protein